MDIKKAENKLDQADSFLTKLKLILKKHWGIILIISALTMLYFLITSEPETINEHYIEGYNMDSSEDEYYNENYPEPDEELY